MADLKSYMERIEKKSEPFSRPRQQALSAPQSATGRMTVPQAAGNMAVQRRMRSGVIQAKLAIAPPGDVHEREADRVAERAVSGHALTGHDARSGATASGDVLRRKTGGAPKAGSHPDGLPADSGRPLSGATRRFAKQAFGEGFDHVRLHDSPTAQMMAGRLGARAFTHGSDIWLGPNANESDRPLMAHELAHMLQQGEGIYLREATWLERRAWLSFFDHYLPRKFLNNYMDDTGAPITLTQQEMIDVNPRVNITTSKGFAKELAALQAQVKANAAAGTPAPAIKYIEVSGPGQAMTNGTLGNFTINYKGMLHVLTDGTWVFIGMMTFYDIWDFDPKPFGTSGRSTAGEIKTRVGAYGIPGQPFTIDSVAAPLVQTGTDPRAIWAGGSPKFVPDKAGRAGADIEVGGVVGAGGGPETEVGGGEVGAQSAEDINP